MDADSRIPTSTAIDSGAALPATGVMESNSEDYVPIHVLCQKCQDIAQRWDQNLSFDIERLWYKEVDLATAAQIKVSSKVCHWCDLIFEFWTNYNVGLAKGWKLGHFTSDEDEGISLQLITPALAINPNYLSIANVYAYRESRHEHEKDQALWRRRRRIIGALEVAIFPNEFSNEHPACLWSKQVPRSPFHYNVETLQKWLSTCVSDHSECRFSHFQFTGEDQRPTRILEIGEANVKLRCDLPVDYMYQYATLSHMWGNDARHQLSLTSQNRSQLENGLAIASLPVVHREAARLTQVLGLTYLWIDSMCIVQDSLLDWQAEAGNMASVYGAATFNLAYPFLPGNMRADSQSTRRAHLPCIIKSASSHREGIYVAPKLPYDYDFNVKSDTPYWRDISKWPLSSRAWILQEQVLCTRTILFGHRNLIWKCRHGVWDEWIGRVVKRQREHLPPGNLPLREARDDGSLNPETSFSEASKWRDLINNYRYRSLTKPGDRVMAFAGVAKAWHNIIHMTYLAGVWSEDLANSMLWSRSSLPMPFNRSGSIVDDEEKVVYTVPSWSWFSVPIRSCCTNALYFNTILLYRVPEATFSYRAKLLSFKWPSYYENEIPPFSYHNFEGLKITLSTPILVTKLVWRHSKVRGAYTAVPIPAKASATLVKRPLAFRISPDNNLSGKAKELPEHVVLCLLADLHIPVYVEEEKHVQCQLAGLVLASSSGRDTWQRIGTWSLTSSKRLLTVPLTLWPNNAQRTIFEFLEGTETKTLTLV